jgi:hypothetical protein
MEKCSQQKTYQNRSHDSSLFRVALGHCKVLIKGLLKKINALKKSPKYIDKLRIGKADKYF